MVILNISCKQLNTWLGVTQYLKYFLDLHEDENSVVLKYGTKIETY